MSEELLPTKYCWEIQIKTTTKTLRKYIYILTIEMVINDSNNQPPIPTVWHIDMVQ